MTNTLTIGERVKWYRLRRGMPQEVLADRVGRTVDWLSKIENNKIDLDRLSVIRALADALDVHLGDLLNEPSLVEWTTDSGQQTVPALRSALMNYRQLTPVLNGALDVEPPDLRQLRQDVAGVWDAYQHSKFGFVTNRLPILLTDLHVAVQQYDGQQHQAAQGLLGLTYQAAASTLTKVGETDLAWIASDRGLQAAQECEDPVVLGSVLRSISHSLLSNGEYQQAIETTDKAARLLKTRLDRVSPDHLSVYGTLLFVGAMAAARAEDRRMTKAFLDGADRAAQRLGQDANYMWTAFGPTNVAIHRVSTAMELGNVKTALDLGAQIDTSGLPTERRVRHALEVARGYSNRAKTDEALGTLLDAEQLAPEQVKYHFLSRQLVLTWIRRQRTKPSFELANLAKRLKVT
ncbi:MAG: helix-turn-helix domain-containing protein [Propionibacteriales bacterium]|nr:helix-turn-helix domain-containing protein [Propionibacteriales bacterium]